MFNVDGFKNETNKDITERILVKDLHSNKTKAWKGFRLWITFWPLPPSIQDRVKCGSSLALGKCIKSYPPTMPRYVLRVCGGWVVGGWLRPIFLFSLSKDEAEQLKLVQ